MLSKPDDAAMQLAAIQKGPFPVFLHHLPIGEWLAECPVMGVTACADTKDAVLHKITVAIHARREMILQEYADRTRSQLHMIHI